MLLIFKSMTVHACMDNFRSSVSHLALDATTQVVGLPITHKCDQIWEDVHSLHFRFFSFNDL